MAEVAAHRDTEGATVQEETILFHRMVIDSMMAISPTVIRGRSCMIQTTPQLLIVSVDATDQPNHEHQLLRRLDILPLRPLLLFLRVNPLMRPPHLLHRLQIMIDHHLDPTQ